MKRPLSVTAIDHPRSVTCPSFSFLFLFLSRIRNFPARREKRKKEKEEEEGEKRADRISVCLQWFTTWKSDGWTEGRKENECAHRYKFVHDGWTDSLPPFLSFQLYGVPLQKKKRVRLPQRALPPVFLLRVVYRYCIHECKMSSSVCCSLKSWLSRATVGNETCFRAFSFFAISSSFFYENSRTFVNSRNLNNYPYLFFVTWKKNNNNKVTFKFFQTEI